MFRERAGSRVRKFLRKNRSRNSFLSWVFYSLLTFRLFDRNEQREKNLRKEGAGKGELFDIFRDAKRYQKFVCARRCHSRPPHLYQELVPLEVKGRLRTLTTRQEGQFEGDERKGLEAEDFSFIEKVRQAVRRFRSSLAASGRRDIETPGLLWSRKHPQQLIRWGLIERVFSRQPAQIQEDFGRTPSSKMTGAALHKNIIFVRARSLGEKTKKSFFVFCA